VTSVAFRVIMAAAWATTYQSICKRCDLPWDSHRKPAD